MNRPSSLAQTGPVVSAKRGWHPARIGALASSLPGRFILLGLAVAADVLILAVVPHSVSLLGPFAPIAIVSLAAFAGLGFSYLKQQRTPLPFSAWLFAGHLVCIAAVSAANLFALHAASVASTGSILFLRVLLLAGLVQLALACIPLSAWIRTFRDTRWLALQALLAGILAWCLRFPMQSFWSPESSSLGRWLQAITFRAVTPLLQSVRSDIYVEPQNFTIGTERFAITIAEECSGMEGLGLVLVFTILWLWYFRKEFRFPQALLLVPAALVSVWVLNILRISSLVLIGNAGAPDIAMVGFHSQAGWIAFTLVALAFSVIARRLSWVRSTPIGAAPVDAGAPSEPGFTAYEQSNEQKAVARSGESPAIAAYLVPLLAILGASFISKAGSGSFEWLYPLRFAAAAVAIWYYRAELRKLDWRIGWAAPLTGIAVSALWIAIFTLTGHDKSSSLGNALMALSPMARWSWITLRVAAAVLTIPIAEELAFRGYLARRLASRDFDGVPFSAITPLGILLAAVANAPLYGQHWSIAWIALLAGIAFGILARRSSRLSDAILAHAACNLILSLWIIGTGSWSLW